jgi:CheY-like chemotaxis protein
VEEKVAGEKVVLVVTHDEGLSQMFQFLLEDEFAVRVAPAFGGQEALSLVATLQPVLILLDWMPDRIPDGPSFLRALKDDTATAAIPVLALAFYLEDGRAAVNAGCAEWITKPFDLEKLLATLAKYLRNLPMSAAC